MGNARKLGPPLSIARAMNDKDRAVDDKLQGASMLANLMTAAAGYAVQRGLPLDRVAEAAGLPPHALVAAPDRVPEDALSRILVLLQQKFPNEAVGLEMATAAALHFLGPLADVARLVPDLRAGIEMFVRFRSVLSTSSGMEFVEASPGPLLRLEHPNDQQFGPHGAEMALVMGARATSEVLGIPDALREVWFEHEPNAPIERYTETFTVPVRFNAPYNALFFRADRLDHPVDPNAGVRLRVVGTHLELVRQQLEQQADPQELQRIREIAARNAAQGEFGAPALARGLGMGVRTLQRRVTELGTSVRAVVDEVRATTARQMLADPDASLLEIALALGYSTESAFRRAFRRWTGQSPGQYRRTLTST